jgi:hypothetical protein
MKIGEDYPKIEWDVLGLELLEPNAFIGDTLIAALAVVLFWKTRALCRKNMNSYNYLWMWFFLVFGVGFFVGGVGHLMYNYFGIFGKYGAWFIGIFSSLLLFLKTIME